VTHWLNDALSQSMPDIDQTPFQFFDDVRPSARFLSEFCNQPGWYLECLGATGLVKWTRMSPIPGCLAIWVCCFAEAKRTRQRSVGAESETHHGAIVSLIFTRGSINIRYLRPTGTRVRTCTINDLGHGVVDEAAIIIKLLLMGIRWSSSIVNMGSGSVTSSHQTVSDASKN